MIYFCSNVAERCAHNFLTYPLSNSVNHKNVHSLTVCPTNMRRARNVGSMVGHWMEFLQLIKSTEDGNAFLDQSLIGSADILQRATIRLARNASNMYSHFKLTHPEAYAVLLPIIQAHDENKRQKLQTTTTTDVMNRSGKTKLMKFFANFLRH